MARTILTGAKVHRQDVPWEQTYDEVLIEDGRIAAVKPGHPISSSARRGDTVVRLPGGRLLPGFFDAHLHLDQGGRFLSCLKLLGMTTRMEVLSAIYEASSRGEGWLIGIGLSEHAWPSLEELDRACPDRPLLLHTRDYHTVLLNSCAIKAAELTAVTGLPSGGWQELDENGQPRGVLRENAARWVEQFLPQESPEQIQALLTAAMRHLLNLGVTGVSDAGDPSSYGNGLLWLEENGGLPIHVESWLRCVHFGADCIASQRRDEGRLKRNRLKLFIDGSLGSRTAWMKDEYADTQGCASGPVPDLDAFREILRDGSAAGWSFTVHAIGDAGVELVAEALADLPAPAGRHRIEHIQHVDAESLRKLKKSNLVLSVQPLHRLDDLSMLVDRIGERWRWAFPLASLNVEDRLVLGTDWPVVDCDPRKTMRAALLPRGEGEGMPGEELGAARAVAAYTRNSARAAGFPQVGRIDPGAEADLVWLTADPGGDPEAWLETEVGAVWKHGEKVMRERDRI